MSTNDYLPNRTFRRLFWAITLCLSVICLLFLALNVTQGPRLRRVTVDQAQVVRQPNQRLVMYANQPLAAVKDAQITVSPHTTFTTTTNGQTLSLQFAQRLRYDTEYTVTVKGVTSQYHRQTTATFTHSFKTGDPTIYFVRRHPAIELQGITPAKQSDEIIQTTLSGQKETTVFSADRIQDYVLFGNSMLVSTISGDTYEDTTNSLYLVDIASKHMEELSLPGRGTVTDLHASPNGRYAGYSFSSSGPYDKQKYQDTLFVVDFAARRLFSTIDGIDGKPLRVMDWQFAPDGTTIAALTDSGLFLVDTNLKHTPLPLGVFVSMSNFSGQGTKLIAGDKLKGPVVLDLLGHTRTPIQDVPPTDETPYPEDARFLQNGDGLIEQMARNDTSTGYDPYLMVSQNNVSKVVFKDDDPVQQLGPYATSPNDQYLSVETYRAGEGSVNDMYPETPKQVNTQTKIVDLQTGKTVKTIGGFNVTWQ